MFGAPGSRNAKVRVFFKEFPFLHQYVREVGVKTVRVSRINGDFLLRRPELRHWAFCGVYAELLLILYKAPKGFTIQDWVSEQIEREIANLKKELSAIDTEAQQ